MTGIDLSEAQRQQAGMANQSVMLNSGVAGQNQISNPGTLMCAVQPLQHSQMEIGQMLCALACVLESLEGPRPATDGPSITGVDSKQPDSILGEIHQVAQQFDQHTQRLGNLLSRFQEMV